MLMQVTLLVCQPTGEIYMLKVRASPADADRCVAPPICPWFLALSRLRTTQDPSGDRCV